MEFGLEEDLIEFKKNNELIIDMVTYVFLKGGKEKTWQEVKEALVSDPNILKYIIKPTNEEMREFLKKMVKCYQLLEQGSSFKLPDEIQLKMEPNGFYKTLLKKLKQTESDEDKDDQKFRGRGKRYPDEQTGILQEFYMSHNSPPNEQEIAVLAEKTKLTTKQVFKWFDNQKRKKKPKRKSIVIAKEKEESEEVEICSNCKNQVSEGEKFCESCRKTEEPPKKKLKKVRKYPDEITNVLEEKFNENEDPNDSEFEFLAKKVNLTDKQVKKWFSNQKRKKLTNPKLQKSPPKPEKSEKKKEEEIDNKRSKILKDYYQQTNNPSLELFREISEKTDLSVLKVMEWFKSKKEKRNKEGKEIEIRGKMFPKEVTDTLKDYFQNESTNPSNDDIEKLCKKTGLNFVQCSKWFNNQRRKYRLNKLELPNPKKLCSVCGNDSIFQTCNDCLNKAVDVEKTMEEFYVENPNTTTEEIHQLAQRLNMPVKKVNNLLLEAKKKTIVEKDPEEPLSPRNPNDYLDSVFASTVKKSKEIEIDFGTKQIHYQIFYGNVQKESQTSFCFECKKPLVYGDPIGVCEYEGCLNCFHAFCFDGENNQCCHQHFCRICKNPSKYKCITCQFSFCEDHLKDDEIQRLISEVGAFYLCNVCKVSFNKL